MAKATKQKQKTPIVKRIVRAVKKATDSKGKQLMVDVELLSARARAAYEDGTLTPLEALGIAQAAITLAAHLAVKAPH